MSDLLLFPGPSGPPSAIPPLADAPARASALDTSRSWIVEAPAGSGKTGLLIQRFLKLLALPSTAQPGQVLGITFTRKATAELRDRVLYHLAEAHRGEQPVKDFDRQTRPFAEAVLTRDHQLGWNLLDNPRTLNIRTIDSVCADIARDLPILSGSTGDLTPTEDAGSLHLEAARRTLMLLGGPDPGLSSALETLLLHRDGNLRDCRKLIADMLCLRDQWAALVPLAKEQLSDEFLDTTILPKFEKALHQAICRSLTRLTQVLPQDTLESLSQLACEMAEAEGCKGASPLLICKELSRSPGENPEDLEIWRAIIHLLLTSTKPRGWRKSLGANNMGFKILKQHQAELRQLIDSLADKPGLPEELCVIGALPPAQYPRDQWSITKALFRVLSRALVELQFVFAERSECDFTEISLLARSALTRDSALDDLATSTGARLQHLLVDEMQDTSSAQYELIQLLTQHWDGGSQTVFLVGDPKQSIYLFRQARVERFVRTMHCASLGDVPLGVLQLTTNFRSQAHLVQSFNQDFSLIFPPAPEPFRPELVPFTPAVARLPPSSPAGRVWHTASLPHNADKAARDARCTRQAFENASHIRSLVEQWIYTPATSTKTIAVLVRNRSHLLDLVKAFRQPGPDGRTIPYRAVDIEPLGERQEILDLLALTRALLHPADRTAWLAILRAPWCGLSLADLHVLTGQDDPLFRQHNLSDLLEQRGELLSPDGVARIQPLWTVMSAALEQRGRLPLSRWVERTWLAFAADRFASPDALANAQTFFRLLDQLEDHTGTLDLATLEQRLRKLFAAPCLLPGAVDLMTIHKSKGLEWDFVILPALEKGTQGNTSRLLSWIEIDAAGDLGDDTIAHGLLAPIQASKTESHRLAHWIRSIHSAREAAERKRVFYVACTRAREELHLFATLTASDKGSLSPRADSLLRSAWSAAEPHFAPPSSNLLSFPDTSVPFVLPSLAAAGTLAAEALPAPPVVLQRIPHACMPDAFRTLSPSLPQAPQPHFQRPEGSFSARAFGNATHAFLEVLATRRAAGDTPAALLAELPSWHPRISNVLRAGGLAAAEVQRFANNILQGLRNTLNDPAGLWITAPHPEAASESAAVSWQVSPTSLAEGPSTLRTDRTFLAGPTPLTSATTHRWIVDYKTTTHARGTQDEFLAAEKAKYRPQLEAYATDLSSPTHPVRLALFYPMLPALVWWSPATAQPEATQPETGHSHPTEP